ncbi:glutamate-cysteine ligase [Coccidioides immitis RMSCC 3703]|nr:glutamate-cysteine ligase [Coccidioides immitis RMSCC 3703]
MVLITRAILSFDLNFYIPIARTTENMETAHARNAVLEKKFYFRKDPFPHRLPRQTASSSPSSSRSPSAPPSPCLLPVESEYELMTVADIINGSPSGEFPGLIPIVESYLNSINIDVETRCALANYLNLIRYRADGRLLTNAKWIREFVAKHPDYKQDSVVSEKICYDLVKAVEKITEKEGKGGSIGWEMLYTSLAKSEEPEGQ